MTENFWILISFMIFSWCFKRYAVPIIVSNIKEYISSISLQIDSSIKKRKTIEDEISYIKSKLQNLPKENNEIQMEAESYIAAYVHKRHSEIIQNNEHRYKQYFLTIENDKKKFIVKNQQKLLHMCISVAQKYLEENKEFLSKDLDIFLLTLQKIKSTNL